MLPPQFMVSLKISPSLAITLGQHIHIGSYEKRIATHPNLQLRLVSSNSTLVSSDFFKAQSADRIPIGVHPNFPKQIKNNKKKEANTITFVGSRLDYYSKFDSKLWSMPNRIDHWDYIASEIASITMKDRFSNQQDYIDHLQKSSFFLCLPGYIMPPCHNLYESMCLGCVPILHESYHKHLPLAVQFATRHFLYSDLHQLKKLALAIQNGELALRETTARNEISALARSNFGIQESLLDLNKIALCAEEHSVDLLRKS